jgi:DNA repair exonuclease SbcCD ATPase subunit
VPESQFRQRLRAIERRHEQQIGELRAIAAHARSSKERIEALEATAARYAKASAVLSSYAQTSQEDVQKKIETLVTHGLTSIFGEGLSFHITSSARGKQTVTNLTVKSTINGQEIETDILSARGGGVAATAGFLLRLTIMLLTPNAPRLLVLDETFAQLSEEYESPLAAFILQLCEKTGTQIVMVTHSREYSPVADRVYRFTNVGGRTRSVEES